MGRVERNQDIYRENEEYARQVSEEEQPAVVDALTYAPARTPKAKPRRRGAYIAGRIFGVIGVLLTVIVVAACLSLVIPKAAGYDAYVVVSGSMEPNIPVGSIVYSKKIDPAELQTGDVIVFIDPARGTTPITHRVVTNDTAAGTLTTKGDANEREDINPTTYDNVIGKVTRHIPRIGFTAAMFTSTLGKVAAALILLEAWLLIEVGRRLIETEKTGKRN